MNDYDCLWNLDPPSSDPSELLSLNDDDLLFPILCDDPCHSCPISFYQEDEFLPSLYLPPSLDDCLICKTESMLSARQDNSTSCSDSPSTITLEMSYPSDMENVSVSDSCSPSQEEKICSKSSSPVRRLLQPKKSLLSQEGRKTRKPNVPRHIRDHIGHLAMQFRSQNHGISMKSIAKKIDRRLKTDFP